MLAIIAVMTPASADVLSNRTIPLDGTVVNPCNLEDIAYTGEERLLFRYTSDQNGGTHLGLNQVARAKGVGSTTGATYALNYTEGGSVSTSFSPPYSFTVVSHQNFLSHGNVPDFMLHATLSITVDDTGNFFATVIDSKNRVSLALRVGGR